MTTDSYSFICKNMSQMMMGPLATYILEVTRLCTKSICTSGDTALKTGS